MDSPKYFEDSTSISALLKTNEQVDIGQCYSFVEEACANLGMKNYMPIIVVVGTESCGKSTLIESLLGMGISYSALGRATYAPVLYRFRKGIPMKGPPTFKCYFKSTNQTKAEVIPIEDLAEKIREVMIHLRTTSKGITTKAIEVTIESSDPEARSFTFIDTPGMFRTDTQKDTVDKKQIERDQAAILKIIDTYASQPENLIIVVENGDYNPAVVDTFSKLVEKHDPNMERTIAVCTHLDKKFEDPHFSAPENLKETEDHLLAWGACFGHKQLPFWVALHHVTFESREQLGFEGVRKEITKQLTDNDYYTKQWTQRIRLGNMNLIPKMGLNALKERVTIEMNTRFLTKAGTLTDTLRLKKREVDESLEELTKQITSEKKDQSTSAVVIDFVHTFVNYFSSLFEGTLPGSPEITEPIYEESGKTLAEEHEYVERFFTKNKWPKNDLTDADFIRYVANGGLKIAHGAERMERLKLEFNTRIMSLTPQDPSDSKLLSLMRSGVTRANVRDLNIAVGQFMQFEGEKIFLKDGCDYLSKRVEAIFRSHADTCVKMMDAMFPHLKISSEFSADFDSALERFFSSLAKEFAEDIRTQARSIISKIDMAAPQEAETVFFFLYGFDEVNSQSIHPTWHKNYAAPPTQRNSQPQPPAPVPSQPSIPASPDTRRPPKKNDMYGAPPSESDEEEETYEDAEEEEIKKPVTPRKSELSAPPIQLPEVDFSRRIRFSREQRMAYVGRFNIAEDDIVPQPRNAVISKEEFDQARFVLRRQFSLCCWNFLSVLKDTVKSISAKLTGSQAQFMSESLTKALLRDENDQLFSEEVLEDKYRWKSHVNASREKQELLKKQSRDTDDAIRRLNHVFQILKKLPAESFITPPLSGKKETKKKEKKSNDKSIPQDPETTSTQSPYGGVPPFANGNGYPTQPYQGYPPQQNHSQYGYPPHSQQGYPPQGQPQGIHPSAHQSYQQPMAPHHYQYPQQPQQPHSSNRRNGM